MGALLSKINVKVKTLTELVGGVGEARTELFNISIIYLKAKTPIVNHWGQDGGRG